MPFFNSVRSSFGPIGRGRLMYNIANGGTVAEATNYLGTGETWKIHVFRANDTFEVINAVTPFRALLVGAGGPVGGLNPKNGGQSRFENDFSLTPGSYSVGVGTLPGGSLSGTTSFNGWSVANNYNSGAGFLSNITGSNVYYGEGGRACCGGNIVDGCGSCNGQNNSCCAPTDSGGRGGCCGGGDGYGCSYGGGGRTIGSGGGGSGGVCGAGASQSGGVLIAYKIKD